MAVRSGFVLWAEKVVPATAAGSLKATSIGAPIPTEVGKAESVSRGSSCSNAPQRNRRDEPPDFLDDRPKRPTRDLCMVTLCCQG